MSSNLNTNGENNNLLLGNGSPFNYGSPRVKSGGAPERGPGGQASSGPGFLYGVNERASAVLQFGSPPPTPSPAGLTPVQPPHQHGLGGGAGANNSAPAKNPSSQIMSGNRNKCLNEKRRREQENIYIEELAELISASIEDMSSLSVKPDKCAILQETVNQIRRIKASEEPCSSSLVAASSAPIVSSVQTSGGGAGQVQQGEVSSSTNILATEILCPLVLEALDGFLFVVNGDGIVEFVSENVAGFINFIPTELVGKSIYNVIHLTDHARFSSSLLPMSIPGGWNNNQSGESESSSKHQRTFNIRVLTKSDRGDIPEDASLSSHYENMQITAMLMPQGVSPQPSTSSSETRLASTSQAAASLDTRLVCIARRLPPNERAPGLPVEQFTTKIQPDGHIIGLDTSGLTPKWSGYLKKEQLVNTLIQELVCEIPKFCAHLRETLKNGSATSAVYRMKFGDKIVMVQTKSKVFAFNPNTEPDFIMATHTIIHNESDSDNPPSTPATPNPQTPRSTPTPTTSQGICPSPSPSIKKQPPTPTSASSTPMLPSPHPHVQDSNNNENNHVSPTQQPVPQTSSSSSNFQTLTLQSQFDDFGLDLCWDFDLESGSFTSSNDPPVQNAPVQQQAPRTNQPIASPAAPNLAATWGVTNSPLSNSSQNSPFTNEQHQELVAAAAAAVAQQQQQQQQQQQVPQQQGTQGAIGSDRLRNLLTVNPLVPRNDNKILKTLLNAADEQEEQPNNMLLKLLNNNAAAQEPITRGTELLQQLLNEDTPTTPGGSSGGLKRTFSMMEENKWQPQQPFPAPLPPSQNVKGDLCKRNPRLVSLLQKPSDPPSSVPLVPPSYLSITPQEKMKIRAQSTPNQAAATPLSPQQHFARNNLLNNLLNNPNRVGSPSATQARSTPSPSHHQLLVQNQIHQAQQQQQQQQQQSASASQGQGPPQSPLLHPSTPTAQHYDSNDAILDEILDQVIDIVPDDLRLLAGTDLRESSSQASVQATHSTLLAGNQNQMTQNNSYYSDDVSNILNLLESNADIPSTLLNSASAAAAVQHQQQQQQQSPSNTHTPSEIAKIDAIQKELMQFETIQQITTTYHNQNSPAPPSAPVTPTSSNVPLLISRTTTTSTIARFQAPPPGPPNRIVPNHQQQQLLQQQKLQLLQRQALNSQGQRVLQNPAIIQQLQELRNRNSTVNLQNLDSLLGGNVPPPNVTLTSNGNASLFNQQQQQQQQNHGGIITQGGNVLLTNNIPQQQQQQLMQQQQLLRLNVAQQQQLQQQGVSSQAPSYNPIASLTQSNQLNQRIVMSNQTAWINQNKARISIQQQNNPMLNAQLGALGSSPGGNPNQQQQQGISPNIQHQLLLRQQQQQNFQAQQQQQQQQQQPQQQFIFNRVRTTGAPGVQQQVVTQQQMLQQQALQMSMQGPPQSPQQLQSPNLLLQSQVSQLSSLVNSPIDVRPNLRAVLGNRNVLQGSSPLVVVSSTNNTLLSSPPTPSSGVPDLDALGFPTGQGGNSGQGGGSAPGGGGVTKVSI